MLFWKMPSLFLLVKLAALEPEEVRGMFSLLLCSLLLSWIEERGWGLCMPLGQQGRDWVLALKL